MSEQEQRSDLLIGLDYSYLHEDWVTPLEEALGGLSVSQALWRPGPDSKCIWEIVLHMAVWNENIVERIATGAPARPAEGHWPTLPERQDEEAWEAAKGRLWESLATLRATIETTSIQVIRDSPYGIGDLLCRFIHNAYHIGQVTKMRECMLAH